MILIGKSYRKKFQRMESWCMVSTKFIVSSIMKESSMNSIGKLQASVCFQS